MSASTQWLPTAERVHVRSRSVIGARIEILLGRLPTGAATAEGTAAPVAGPSAAVDEVVSLVAMLVQTDKFGTSVAQSLRVHSENLRMKRRQRAEEKAAKLGAKMVFPLVICIFPAIWVVTIGPAAIKFIEVFTPLAEGR